MAALFYEPRALLSFCTTSLTVNDQFFPVVMFNALNKVFLTFEFVDKYPWVWPSIATCNYKGIQDSLTFWILRHGFRTPGIGFRISIVSGIPNSLSLITDSKAREFRIPQTKFPGFRIAQVKIFLDSVFHKQRSPGYRNPYSVKGVTWK